MVTTPTGQSGAVCTLGSTQAKCFDASGSLQSSSSVLNGLLANVLAPGAGFGAHGNAVTIGSRIYWPRGSYVNYGPTATQLECFDQATNAQCPNFPLTGASFDNATDGGAQGSVYTIQPDPVQANCFWTNDNFANILVWNALTGRPGCATPGQDFIATYKAAKVFPRLTCNGDAVSAWGKVKVSDISGGSYTTALLTVLDSNNNPIAGWTNVTTPLVKGNPTISLDGLSVSQTGPTPKFQVKLVGLDSSSGSATITVSKTGSAPELCVGLEARATCPSLAALASGVQPRIASTKVFAGVDVTAAGVGTVSKSVKLLATVRAATANQCQQLPAPPDTGLSGLPRPGSLQLRLTAPMDTGGAKPKDLVYHYSVDGGDTWQTIYPDAKGQVTTTITDLPWNTDVCVETKTENYAGWSSWFNTVCSTTTGGFTCPGSGSFQVVDNQLFQGNVVGGMTSMGYQPKVNAIGLNDADGLIYGISVSVPSHLISISSSGEQTDLGAVQGLPNATNGNYLAGDVDPSTGTLYVSRGGKNLYAIDLASRTARSVTIPANVLAEGGMGFDMVVAYGKLWSVTKRSLVAIDLSTGQGSVKRLPSADAGTNAAAMWYSPDAGLSWATDVTGTTVLWGTYDGTTDPIVAIHNTWVPFSVINDGASCHS